MNKHAEFLRNFKQAMRILYGDDEAEAILADSKRFVEKLELMRAGAQRRKELVDEVLDLESRLIGDSKSDSIGHEIMAATLEEMPLLKLRDYRDDLARLVDGENLH